MRFNLAIFGMILAGTALAVPVQETFESNREKILAGAMSVIGDWVFSVGRTKQTLRAGDEVGFSKAATLAYANLDLLNFKSAPWPASVGADERKAAWLIYRGRHPFRLTIEGGQRVCSRKTGKDRYLVVMAFPRAGVFADAPQREDLDAAVAQCREELKKLAEEMEKLAAEQSATNKTETQASQPIEQKKSKSKLRKHECLNVDLIFSRKQG